MVRTSPIARLDHARLVDWMALAPEYKTITCVPSAGSMFMKPTARCAVVATSVFCEVRAVHPVMPVPGKSTSSPKENRPAASGLTLASKLGLVMETSAPFAPESANTEVASETSSVLVYCFFMDFRYYAREASQKGKRYKVFPSMCGLASVTAPGSRLRLLFRSSGGHCRRRIGFWNSPSRPSRSSG